MDKKSVLQTAFSELISGGSRSEEVPGVDGSLAYEPEPAPVTPSSSPAEPSASQESNITHIGGNARPCSIISKEMVVDGSIDTDGDVILAGKIKGNIKCSGKLTLYGQIEGNINAQEIVMAGARVRGITLCSSNVTIDASTSVVGSIECADLQLEGKVEGDVVASGNVTLKHTAYLLGDLQLGGISVELGARLIGRVTTKDAPPPPAAPAVPAAPSYVTE